MLCKFHYYINYNLKFVKLISIGVQHGGAYLKLCARLQMKDIRILFIKDFVVEKECQVPAFCSPYFDQLLMI